VVLACLGIPCLRDLSPLAKGVKAVILLLVSRLMFLEEDKIVFRVVYDLAAIF